MNQQRIEYYMNELATMLSTYEEQSKQNAQAKATLTMLDAAGKQEQAMQTANQLAESDKVLSVIETVIAKKTKKTDIESARKLYTDIVVRVQNVDKFFEEWRRIEASFELAVTIQELPDDKRSQAEDALSKARERYEQQLALVDALLPSTIELL